jgi:hypothetical protein
MTYISNEPKEGSVRRKTMGRRPQGNYVEAAKTVLTELGGGPISSRGLVAAAQERGLVGDGKWVYHNFLRKVRESGEFDTSVRGQISLVTTAPEETTPEPTAEAEVEEKTFQTTTFEF